MDPSQEGTKDKKITTIRRSCLPWQFLPSCSSASWSVPCSLLPSSFLAALCAPAPGACNIVSLLPSAQMDDFMFAFICLLGRQTRRGENVEGAGNVFCVLLALLDGESV